MENDSTFNIYKIGPRLAELQTLIERKKYFCKVADYNAVVWDWNEQYPWHIDTIEQSCFVLTTDKSIRPMFGDNICLSYYFDSPRDDDSACIGIIDYNHEYKNYPNITDGKITFYDYSDNCKDRLVKLPNEDLMYGYIDYVIDYMNLNDEVDLNILQLKDLLQEYAKTKELDNPLKLKRKKDV